MRNKILVLLFCCFLLTFFMFNLLKSDTLVSKSERRKLQTFPTMTVENILDGEFFSKFNSYADDQFIFRDQFRKIKSLVSKNIFLNKDNNRLYIKDNHLFKLEYPYNKGELLKTINKINNVVDRYLSNNQVYYSIIPDKNYFASDDYLKLDYKDMKNTINSNLPYNYIDLFNEVKLDDYYYTDPHIKQDCYENVVKKIVEGMNNNYFQITSKKNTLKDFYGSFYSQLGLTTLSDSMVYLTNEYINEASVSYLENDKLHTIYNLDKYYGMDPYDIYLDGATALVEITNNKTHNNQELIIFRDSFGSSIAPLLIPYYEKITLVDLRYLSSDLLDEYIDFNNQDVLFLYSTLIYNANILK